MSDSPLQFTRDFDRLKGSLAVIHTPDIRLLLLTDFWPKLKDILEYKSFSSYSDEYFPLILRPVFETDLGDLRIEELRSIIDRLSDIAKSGDVDPSNAGFTNFQAKIQATTNQSAIALAKKLFYIGETEAGLEVCKFVGQEPCFCRPLNAPSGIFPDGKSDKIPSEGPVRRTDSAKEIHNFMAKSFVPLVYARLLEFPPPEFVYLLLWHGDFVPLPLFYFAYQVAEVVFGAT